MIESHPADHTTRRDEKIDIAHHQDEDDDEEGDETDHGEVELANHLTTNQDDTTTDSQTTTTVQTASKPTFDPNEAATAARIFYWVFHILVNLILLLYDNDLRLSLQSRTFTPPFLYLLLTVGSGYLFYRVGKRPGYVGVESDRDRLEGDRREYYRYFEKRRRGEGEENEEGGDENEGGREEIDDEEGGINGGEEKEDGVEESKYKVPPFHFCKVCNIVQKYRTRHCKSCNQCVAKFDHHCFWVGSCVGELNHRIFFIMLVSMTVQFSYGLTFVIFFLQDMVRARLQQ